MQSARDLYSFIGNKGRDIIKEQNLGAITELRFFSKEERIEFSINWFDTFSIAYRPQTIGLKIKHVNKLTKESKSISKSYPLEQEGLFDIILGQYKSVL